MFNNSYQIGRIFGIPIKLDLSLILLAGMMVYQYGLKRGLFAATALLLSIVLHELGHSLVAIKMGYRVREITLLLLGGRAMMEQMPRKPWQEFLMALAGPAVSALLGVGSWLAMPSIYATFGQETGLFIFWHVSALNIALCVFNLLPAFPMDGGRILRALLAQRLGSVRATRIAMIIGRILAVIMGFYALYPPTDFVLLLIAWFIFSASAQEYRIVQYEAMQHHDFMDHAPSRTDEIVVSPPPYARKRSFWR